MLWRDLRAWQIYGANTDIGKTIFSTILCKALANRAQAKNGLLYLKPVSTGPQTEADDKHLSRHAPGALTKCLQQYSKAVSPHLAAKIDRPDLQQNNKVGKLGPFDRSLLAKVKETLDAHQRKGGRFAVVETAGGVLSPGPSGTVQADLYRPLRLPVLLIGDSKLGGIGNTISAFESLHIRGYDVQSVLLFDDPKWGNFDYLNEYLAQHDIQTFALPPPPAKVEDSKQDEISLNAYYENCASSPTITSLIDLLQQKHFSRISKLTSMPAHAESVIWHPFRQYGLPQNVIAIDSAYEDHFETYNQETDPAMNVAEDEDPGLTTLKSSVLSSPLLKPLFDGSASWWTQGLGHGNPNLSLTAAGAAGRYGHVMFASAVHEPALDLSYNLLSTLKNPRLSRVFFTDNGSTGMEVAVKMALRASCKRYGWSKEESEHPIGIIGLQGSYHGDTIGVMNCSEPSPFNEKVDWYKPWGYWFAPPEVKMRKGEWHVELPKEMHHESHDTVFSSLSDIFDFENRSNDEEYYTDYVTRTLTHLTHHQKRRFGALMLEPLIMGAGGMIFVDPLFQRTLIKTIRSNPSLVAPGSQPVTPENAQSDQALSTDWSGLPIIADEVFTGLYRLGRASSSSFLSASTSTRSSPVDIAISPDISVHAKLLTGGLIPLALTTASEAVFNTFMSDRKPDALLHGHSYTAHPIGCAVANKSLDMLQKLSEEKDGEWVKFRRNWSGVGNGQEVQKSLAAAREPLFSFWSPVALVDISNHPRVSSCFAIGTVLALTLESSGPSGYNSMAAASLQSQLLTTLDDEGRGIHSRVLGNVIYFMTSLETRREMVEQLEKTILRGLDNAQ